MNTKILASLALLILSNSASAQSLYLTCKTSSYPKFDRKIAYKTPPSNIEQFYFHMFDEGLANLVAFSPESWTINIAEARISSPDNNSGPQFSDASISKTKVTASSHLDGTGFFYDLNRITGKLTYSIHLTDDTVKSWRDKHGGEFPSIWKWEQLCTAASRPKL